MFQPLYPVKMKPAFKDYLWGGRRLIDEWGMPCELEKAAEAWVLSAHPNGQSVADSGPQQGKTLSDLIVQWGGKCLGRRGASKDGFPILIKLIDAAADLSIQVHPNDAYALAREGSYGKTELWYVAQAEENATLLCGFSRSITDEEYTRRIADNTLAEVLNTVPVKEGDVFFIAPGTVHAIGAGVIIAEIQQNSDITYRVSDYGRIGPDGRPRPLHIEKAREVTNLKASEFDGRPHGACTVRDGYMETVLAQCEYFSVTEYHIFESLRLDAGGDTFEALLFLGGDAVLEHGGDRYPARKGDCYFVPAGMGAYTVTGRARLLVTRT